jgi:hypothetical protein
MRMIVTITEMSDRIYWVDVRRNGRRRCIKMTRNLRDAIRRRGTLQWKTANFGSGKSGGQCQYLVTT